MELRRGGFNKFCFRVPKTSIVSEFIVFTRYIFYFVGGHAFSKLEGLFPQCEAGSKGNKSRTLRPKQSGSEVK